MSRAILRVQNSSTSIISPLRPFFTTPTSAQRLSQTTSTSAVQQVNMATKAPPVMATRVSQCLCKSIRVEFTGQDKGAVLCHCNNCKQASGSAFMHNHRFMKTQIRVTQGEDLLREYADTDTKSGNTLFRHFCANCGSPLWLSNSAIKGFAAVNAGNLQGEKRQPTFEIFGENKHAWIGDVSSKPSKL